MGREIIQKQRNKIFNKFNNKLYSEFKKEKGLIKIGRNIECDIVLNDTGISREHCMINFDSESKNWYIKDGNKDNLSGGGTWYFFSFLPVILYVQSRTIIFWLLTIIASLLHQFVDTFIAHNCIGNAVFT